MEAPESCCVLALTRQGPRSVFTRRQHGRSTLVRCRESRAAPWHEGSQSIPRAMMNIVAFLINVPWKRIANHARTSHSVVQLSNTYPIEDCGPLSRLVSQANSFVAVRHGSGASKPGPVTAGMFGQVELGYPLSRGCNMALKHRRAKAAPRLERLETRTLLSLDGWQGYALDPQHTALSPVASAGLGLIHWQTPVDLAPQYSGGDLLIHYGSPLVTASNTVLVPVKTGASGGFEIQSLSGATGASRWTLTTDYMLMPASGTNGYELDSKLTLPRSHRRTSSISPAMAARFSTPIHQTPPGRRPRPPLGPPSTAFPTTTPTPPPTIPRSSSTRRSPLMPTATSSSASL